MRWGVGGWMGNTVRKKKSSREVRRSILSVRACARDNSTLVFRLPVCLLRCCYFAERQRKWTGSPSLFSILFGSSVMPHASGCCLPVGHQGMYFVQGSRSVQRQSITWTLISSYVPTPKGLHTSALDRQPIIAQVRSYWRKHTQHMHRI